MDSDSPKEARIHVLKCWPPFFAGVKSGAKPFEIRKNDRDFQLGDTLCLREWDPKTEKYSGDETSQTVTWITTGWGLPSDVVVMGLGRSLLSRSEAASAETEAAMALAEAVFEESRWNAELYQPSTFTTGTMSPARRKSLDAFHRFAAFRASRSVPASAEKGEDNG